MEGMGFKASNFRQHDHLETCVGLMRDCEIGHLSTDHLDLVRGSIQQRTCVFGRESFLDS